MKLFVTGEIIAQTMGLVRDGSRRPKETVALWLGRRQTDQVRVVEVVRPDQESGRDFFRIPPPSMEALHARLRDDNLMIGAQVHTHPQDAFHSDADDRWAIVRHIGALSLVLPRFARDTTTDNFWTRAAVFVLDERGRWVAADAGRHVEVTG